MKLKKKLITITAAIIILTTGCSDSTSANTNTEDNSSNVSQEVYEETETSKDVNEENDVFKEDEFAKEEIENKEKEEKQKIDLQEVKPNEAGQIMVLMYHAIGEPEAEFRRTPDNLRKDLQYLYDNGYRPISLKDYVTGNITTEAGYTPIVLTFDDGWQDNFSMVEDKNGELVIDPDSAVGILENFHEDHPDFPLEVSFFVNDNVPFGQTEHLEYKLKYIIDKGMDVGNHTATHVNFTSVSPERIQKEISGIKKMVGEYLPDYEVNTLALPFGSRPKNKDLYKYLEKGNFEGIEYKNIAILNVGWDPYKSPYHTKFNPLSIHRVRASELEKYVQDVGMYDWVERFEKGQRTKFVSDGDPDIVTIPKNFEEVIDKDKIGGKEVRTYELDE